MPAIAHPPTSRSSIAAVPLQRVAALLAAANAAIYVLIAAGVLSVGRADGGELGVLGAAGAVYLVLGALLWFVARWWLWLGAAIMQVMIIAMYIAVAPQRDPHYELWGISLRVLQVALIATLVTLLVRAVRDRGGRSRGQGVA
jgi:hypothetical protein